MKIRKPKKARMFHGHQKYTDNLVVIKFSETTFGILKKIEKEWILGSIPHKGIEISIFLHEPLLQGNAFSIDGKIVPLNYLNFNNKVFFFWNPKIKINLGFAKKEYLISLPTL